MSDEALVRAAIRGWHYHKFPDQNITGKAFECALASYRAEKMKLTPSPDPEVSPDPSGGGVGTMEIER